MFSRQTETRTALSYIDSHHFPLGRYASLDEKGMGGSAFMPCRTTCLSTTLVLPYITVRTALAWLPPFPKPILPILSFLPPCDRSAYRALPSASAFFRKVEMILYWSRCSIIACPLHLPPRMGPPRAVNQAVGPSLPRPAWPSPRPPGQATITTLSPSPNVSG